MTEPTIDQMREDVMNIDSMSQSAFSEIATIANLALKSLERPEAYDSPDCMAYVLKAIWGKAKEAENYINCEAEGVGCNYKDAAMFRRWEAQSKAQKPQLAGGLES